MTDLDPLTRPQAPALPAAEAAGRQAGPRRPPRRPRALPTVLAALACFAVAFEFLAFQLTSGHDPALGAAGAPQTAQSAQARPVQKRVVITRVVGSGSAATSPAGSASPSPAAAPAAPPAPVVTSSS
jgi:hypothetical protein